jgi:vacuolar-type H+-ATPase subunit F/Vma7
MKWVVISDEVGAQGWRLAGALPLISGEHNIQERLTEARLGGADLVIITPDLAQCLPDFVLNAALLVEKPFIAVLGGLPGDSEPPDLEREVQHLLGIAL